MRRLPRRGRALTFDLLRTDRDHDVFLNRDVPALTDDQVWAERKLREAELADLICRDDHSVILGSDVLAHAPLTEAAWVRCRLQALQAESRRRTMGRAS